MFTHIHIYTERYTCIHTHTYIYTYVTRIKAYTIVKEVRNWQSRTQFGGSSQTKIIKENTWWGIQFIVDIHFLCGSNGWQVWIPVSKQNSKFKRRKMDIDWRETITNCNIKDFFAYIFIISYQANAFRQ